MYRSLTEPIFIFTTMTTIQIWSLDEYREYLAVHHGWSRSMKLGSFDLQVIMPGEVSPRDYTLTTALTEEKAVEDGVSFTEAVITLQSAIYDQWEDDAPVYIFSTWLPEDTGGQAEPWAWLDNKLIFLLNLPELDEGPTPV